MNNHLKYKPSLDKYYSIMNGSNMTDDTQYMTPLDTTGDFCPETSSLLFKSQHIVKSESDERCYRAVTLSNELKVLLISDSEADKSAACLAVRVGSFSDPVDIPGLAHFCEHMILLGSEAFPNENEYSKFISAHNGFCNAYTSATETSFVFDIAPDYLARALEIFAELFVSPLFTPSAVEREVIFKLNYFSLRQTFIQIP